MDRSNHALLDLFWSRENTVAAVARTLNLKPNAVLYRVKTMLKLGLLEVTRRQARRGRTITHYRLAAEEFFIPFEVTRFENKAAFVRAQLEPMFRVMVETEGRETPEDEAHGGWGLLVYKNAQENILTQPRLRDQRETRAKPTRFMRAWGTGKLSPEHAHRFLEGLHALLEELHELEDEGPEAKKYLFQLTMMPIEDELI